MLIKFTANYKMLFTHHKKNGNQQAKNAETIIPKVLAAFLSLFILLQLPGSLFSATKSASTDCLKDVNPAEIPFICRCLLSSAAATLLLQQKSRCFKGTVWLKRTISAKALVFWYIVRKALLERTVRAYSGYFTVWT